MTKADLVSEITDKTGVEKIAVQATVESLMTTIIDAMESGKNVYLRGFGSFVIKKRAEKTGRDISKNTTLIIPEHFVPTFKPAKTFVNGVKNKLKK
jgi:DNA-binding protein HU-beta